MFECFTVRGAYGRAYTSQSQIRADFLNGLDFQLVDSGRYINLEDCQRGKIPSLNVRYVDDRKAFQVFTSWADAPDVVPIFDEVIPIHQELDLVGSVDDCGYYFHEFYPLTDRVSVTYPGKAEALAALKSDSIEWTSPA